MFIRGTTNYNSTFLLRYTHTWSTAAAATNAILLYPRRAVLTPTTLNTFISLYSRADNAYNGVYDDHLIVLIILKDTYRIRV